MSHADFETAYVCYVCCFNVSVFYPSVVPLYLQRQSGPEVAVG
jgi:hypothetical protein